MSEIRKELSVLDGDVRVITGNPNRLEDVVELEVEAWGDLGWCFMSKEDTEKLISMLQEAADRL